MMIGFDDDEHESGTLPNWATLTEVSSALGIAREAVRSVARRALRKEELWVKKKDGKILIDTTADLYKSHVSRWQKQQDVQGFASLGDELDPFDAADAKWRAHQAKAPMLYHHFPSLMLEGYRDWPDLCSWLGSQGLNVFFNMLVNERDVSLQWQWGDLQGGILLCGRERCCHPKGVRGAKTTIGHHCRTIGSFTGLGRRLLRCPENEEFPSS